MLSDVVGLRKLLLAVGLTRTAHSENNARSISRETAKACGTAALIETDNAGDVRDLQVAVDASWNALMVWLQYDHHELARLIWP